MLINRRTFIEHATILAAGSVVPLASGESASGGWQIGCYTRPWDHYDYRVALDAIAEAGFKYAGIMTAKGRSWVMINPETTSEEAARIGWEVAQRGLKTASVYGDFQLGSSHAASVQALQRLIDHCVTCDSGDLLLGGTSEQQQYEPYYKAIADCCDYAAERKVRMTIKPHGGQNATGRQCRQAIKKVGHRSFRLWYDPGNILYYSDGALDPVKEAGFVDGLVVGMSVKDFRPPKEVMVTPGSGVVDFPKVLGRLRKGGFKQGPLVIECLAAGDVATVTAEARRARLYLEQLVEQAALEATREARPALGTPAGRLRAGPRLF
ncbi:MAG: sugar phosphate isomerase/epimerase family protein [Verrucomicrobiota bacterium]|nr:sugar phosphate isomerase/epimerase family protein [Verrucomicrobiota bacterium]